MSVRQINPSIQPGTIPCLSLWQPWASSVVLGIKRNETRGWPTSYRGPIAIHAAAVWHPEARALMRSDEWRYVQEHVGLGTVYPLGAIVGFAEIVDCLPMVNGPCAASELDINTVAPVERILGLYIVGRFAFRLRLAYSVNPIPYKGRQGWFNVPRHFIAKGTWPDPVRNELELSK